MHMAISSTEWPTFRNGKNVYIAVFQIIAKLPVVMLDDTVLNSLIINKFTCPVLIKWITRWMSSQSYNVFSVVINANVFPHITLPWFSDDYYSNINYFNILTIERLSMTFTANGKQQKWNFCRLSSAVCTVEWNYFYLQWMVGTLFHFCAIYKFTE